MDYAIIAAGEGSRLVQEGVKWPKPLVQLNGTALIDRLINVFLKNDASSISIIVNEEMTEVQEHLRKLDLFLFICWLNPRPVPCIAFMSLAIIWTVIISA